MKKRWNILAAAIALMATGTAFASNPGELTVRDNGKLFSAEGIKGEGAVFRFRLPVPKRSRASVEESLHFEDAQAVFNERPHRRVVGPPRVGEQFQVRARDEDAGLRARQHQSAQVGASRA